MSSYKQRGKNSFLLIVELGYVTGKRDRRTKTIRVDDEIMKSKRKLEKLLDHELYKFEREVQVGEYIAPSKSTLVEFIPDWENKYALKHLAPSTVNHYLSTIRTHIIPELGQMRVDQIKPIHVVNFLDHTSKKLTPKGEPLSDATVEYAYRVLRNIFNCATKWELINKNPVESVKKPEVTKKKMEVYDEEEIQILFSALQNELNHWRMFMTLALAAGMRRGELLALEKSAIDLEIGTIDVHQAFSIGKDGPELGPPKTESSKRLISLSVSVLDELKLFLKERFKEIDKLSDIQKNDEHHFIFANLDGSPFYPTTPTTWWRRFTERTGIRHIRLHDLRHTAATIMISQGIHAKIISERLGHSGIKITMDTYGHTMRKADHEAAQKIDHVFAKKKVK